MKRMAWALLTVFVAAACAGCPDKDKDKDKPKRKESPDAPKTRTPTQPSTRPREHIEAGEIFERLIQPPRDTLVPSKTPPGPRGAAGAAGPTEAPPPVKAPAPGPAGKQAAKAPKEAPATQKAPPPRFLPARRKTASGYVDWSRGRIVATGRGKAKRKGAQGKLMALKAAETLARRNALLAAAGVGKPAAGTIEVRGTIRGAKTLTRQFDEKTRTATVTVEVPMYGVQGTVRVDGEKIKVKGKRWNWIVRDPVRGESDLILIDARRTDFEPVLAPRLVNEAGEIVFDPADGKVLPGERHAFVYVEYSGTGRLIHHGAFRRVILLAPAKADKGSLVLTGKDMRTLMRHLDARELLRAGRAVIITRPARPSPPPAPAGTI